MKTIENIIQEVISKHQGEYHETRYPESIMEMAIRQYAIQLLNHLMAEAKEYIYTDDGEAVFSYNAIDKLKKSINEE